jgi:hypothetical protein
MRSVSSTFRRTPELIYDQIGFNALLEGPGTSTARATTDGGNVK